MSSPEPPSETAGLTWRCSPFGELSLHELQAIYQSRQQVFVLEQHCLYQDADGVDEACCHLAAWPAAGGPPLAYARLVRPGVKYAEPSIGRVLTLPSARGAGLGRTLVQRAIAELQTRYPGRGIRIAAQSRLERFYGELGFAVVGEPYLEDDILHTEMLREG